LPRVSTKSEKLPLTGHLPARINAKAATSVFDGRRVDTLPTQLLQSRAGLGYAQAVVGVTVAVVEGALYGGFRCLAMRGLCQRGQHREDIVFQQSACEREGEQSIVYIP
jgi:hypothetical protein